MASAPSFHACPHVHAWHGASSGRPAGGHAACGRLAGLSRGRSASLCGRRDSRSPAHAWFSALQCPLPPSTGPDERPGHVCPPHTCLGCSCPEVHSHGRQSGRTVTGVAPCPRAPLAWGPHRAQGCGWAWPSHLGGQREGTGPAGSRPSPCHRPPVPAGTVSPATSHMESPRRRSPGSCGRRGRRWPPVPGALEDAGGRGSGLSGWFRHRPRARPLDADRQRPSLAGARAVSSPAPPTVPASGHRLGLWFAPCRSALTLRRAWLAVA